ncbi:TPA: MFS transporter [Streptococcus agalactiae]|nr:MFS transporter [Streptococcus agalactiae]HEO0033218.1 MFS transporter [Streptococcus agalactiae]HEO6432064.1 MFS transporter [Streptococcus agalactiae]
MLKKLFAPPQKRERLSAEEIKHKYPRYRVQVLISIFVGYMGYYFVRNTTSILSGILNMSATEIGIITCASYIAYGLSKFISGLISDESNSKIFLPVGLFLTGLVNVLIGVIPSVITSIWLFTIMYLINGWLQGMGYPPGARTLVYWYDNKERIKYATIWNLSHNFGGAIAPILTGVGLALAGNDSLNQARAAYWFPGVVACLLAVLVYFLQEDTPESIGLPPIEEYHKEQYTNVVDSSDILEEPEVLGMGEIIKKYILPNTKLMWASLYSIFVYILRYGIVSWTPKFLATSVQDGGKGITATAGMGGFSLFEIGGIIGMLTAGYLSAKVFKNSKPLTNVAFLVVAILLLAACWFIPAGPQYMALDFIILLGLGASIYGPVMMVGLYAMELVPKAAAGAASGLTGTFSYVGGATIATLAIGIIIDHFGWGVAFIIFGISGFAAIVCTLLSRDKSLEYW